MSHCCAQSFGVGVAAFFAPNATEAFIKEEMSLSDGIALDLRDAAPPAWLYEVGKQAIGANWLEKRANALYELGSDINARGTPTDDAPKISKDLIENKICLKIYFKENEQKNVHDIRNVEK